MRTLNILICGGDDPALKRMAKAFTDEGVTVATSTQVIDSLCFSHKEWDFLLVDLDGLSSFLRSLLPAVCRKFPNLPMVGISTKSAGDINTMGLGYGLELDDYLFDVPRIEDLVVRFPQIAAKYLMDTNSIAADPVPLPS